MWKSNAPPFTKLPANFRSASGAYNRTLSTEFLDRVGSQLKIGQDAVCRRAIERILDVIKKGYENRKYQNSTEAERDFWQLVEHEENGR